ALLEGARHRFRPIVMTALATIGALTPMALSITGGGAFISQPLALVVIGGLISSTALTLLLVPVLYRLVEGWNERRRARRATLASALEALPTNPRVAVSGNHSVPWPLVHLRDATLERYTLNLLNAPAGVPDREGVTLETCFVGVGQRRSPRLRYVPSRLSMGPVLFREQLPVDAVL